MLRTVATLALVTAAACATASAPPAPAARPFAVQADSAEYRAYQAPGRRELSGQAFLTTRGGDVKLAAGRLVTLDPATQYAKQWFSRFGATVTSFDEPPADPLFRAARRTTTANAEGRFRFTGLPAGEYLVRTTVTWETGAAYSGLQGGVVAALATVSDSGNAEIILNRVYSPSLASTLGVSFVSPAELGSRPHRSLGAVSGVSCQVGLLDAAPTEERARQELLLAAARKNADAVAGVECRKHGMSLRPNCTSRIVCEGDAIGF